MVSYASNPLSNPKSASKALSFQLLTNSGETYQMLLGILDEVEVIPTTEPLPLLNDSVIEQGSGAGATASCSQLLSMVWVSLVTVFITRLLML